jgi:hypothetical protein
LEFFGIFFPSVNLNNFANNFVKFHQNFDTQKKFQKQKPKKKTHWSGGGVQVGL